MKLGYDQKGVRNKQNKGNSEPYQTRESMGRSRRRKRQRLVAKAEAEQEQAVATAAGEGGAFPVLPGELILEIVWRVPAKRVLQLRCVCKSWKSLISEPHFMKANLQRSFSDIDACASRAVKVLDAIGSVLNSVEYENLTVVLLDSVIASLDIVRGELRQIKRGVILHQSFLKNYNSR